MRIDIKPKGRNLQQVNGNASLVSFTTSSAESNTITTNTFIDAINRKKNYYQATPVDLTLDYIDQPQAPKMFLSEADVATSAASAASQIRAGTTISLVDALKNSTSSLPKPATTTTPSAAALTVSAAQTAANIIRTTATSPIGNTKAVT